MANIRGERSCLRAKETASVDATRGLPDYQFLPEHLVCEDAKVTVDQVMKNMQVKRVLSEPNGELLLQHLTKWAKRHHDPKSGPLRSSAYLDVEMTADQQVILDPSPVDLVVRELMKDAQGDGATKKLAQRKLNSTGFVSAFCGSGNGDEEIRRLRQAAQLAASLADAYRVEQEESKQKKEDEDAALEDHAPAALEKLRATGMQVQKLTVAQMRAICLVHFKREVPKKKKAVVQDALETLIAKYPKELPAAIASLPPLVASQAKKHAGTLALMAPKHASRKRARP